MPGLFMGLAQGRRGIRFTDAERVRLLTEAVQSSKMRRDAWEGFQGMPGFDELRSDTFRTHYKVKADLTRAASVHVQDLPCCINGCRLFYGSFAQDDECICAAKRYHPDVSLGRQVALS